MFRVFEPVVSETGDTRCLAQALPFDRFVVTASTERVACWIDRRFHQRAQLYEPEDTQTSAPRPHMRVVNRSLTLEESDRPPARAARFDRFAVTVSTERVRCWSWRRSHHRLSLAESSDAKTTAISRIHE